MTDNHFLKAAIETQKKNMISTLRRLGASEEEIDKLIKEWEAELEEV